MNHRQYTGRRVRRRRQRRRLKAAMLAGVLAGLLLAISPWMTIPPPAPVQGLCEQELAVARTLYELSGDNGFAHEYLVKSTPEQAAYIRTGK